MAGERLAERFSLRSQLWFRWTGKCFETATSHMQTVVRQHKKQTHDKQEDERNFCNTNFIIDTFCL